MTDIQIAIIEMLQTQAAWLIEPALVFSFLGRSEFYLLVVSILYWCWDPRLGLRLGLLMGISGGLNEALKIAFHLPRPYWVSPEIRAYESQASFGLPSGHALGAATLWGLLAADARRWWLSAFAFVMIFLIGASRIVSGVHYPTDVIGGWIIGFLILIGFLTLERPVARRIASLSTPWQVFVAFAASIVLILIPFAALLSVGDWEVPAFWSEGALERSGEPIDPLSLWDTLTVSGFFFGFAAGAAVDRHRWSLCSAEDGSVRFLGYAFGIMVIGAIWFGLGLLISPDPAPGAYALQYIRTAVAGAWISFGAPAFFARYGPGA